MGFTRFVEVGRVALISFGENQGSLCTIVDILDGQKVSTSERVRVAWSGSMLARFRGRDGPCWLC